MRFAIVTLCFLFVSASAWAVEPIEWFGFNLGDSKSKVVHVLKTSKDLATMSIGGYGDNGVSAIISYDGFYYTHIYLSFSNERLTQIRVDYLGDWKKACRGIEYMYKCEPVRISEDTIAVYRIHKDLYITVYNSAYSESFYYTRSDGLTD